MRITKVKVNKDFVKIVRENENVYLQVGSKRIENIQEFIEKQKIDSFLLSVKNKTIRKNSKKDDDKAKENITSYKALIDKVLDSQFSKSINEKPVVTKFIKNFDQDKIKSYLSHHFQKKLEFKDYNKNEKEIDLASEIANCFEKNKEDQNNFNLPEYSYWAKSFVEKKQKYIAKSIKNNVIDFMGETETSRKKALKIWANNLINNDIDFSSLENDFAINDICREFNTIYTSEKITETDIKDELNKAKNEDEKKKVREKIGLPKNIFDFKQNLKKALRTQQTKIIFVNNQKTNACLVQYSLELTKYLALYFPLKKSGKRLSVKDINYYLKEDTIKKYLQYKIKNATIQFLLQQGKAINYELNNCNSSQGLQLIKIKESFALQFIDACAFAANNLRNCVNQNEKKDILGKKEFIYALENIAQEEIIKNIAQFFIITKLVDNSHSYSNLEDLKSKLNINKLDFIHFMSAIRSSITNIRNNVIHYKKDANDTILNNTNFEVCSNLSSQNNQSFLSNTLLKELLIEELNNLNYSFAEKIKSMSLFEYYPYNNIKETFDNFYLFSKDFVFTPSFNKVFEMGKASLEDNDYLDLKVYFKESKENTANYQETKQLYEAKRNALKQVYELHFRASFLEDPVCFSAMVTELKEKNKNRASISNKVNAYAFSGIENYDDWQHQNKTPIKYLEYIQSTAHSLDSIIEDNKKNHFADFLVQLFTFAFDDFIKKNYEKYNFIFSPVKQKVNADELNNLLLLFSREIKINHSLEHIQDKDLAFWTFAKMLDAKHLNSLSNQFCKFAQVKAEMYTKEQEILAICILNADHMDCSNNKNKEIQDRQNTERLEILKQFVSLNDQAVKNEVDLYAQANGDIIANKHLLLLSKYATVELLKNFIQKNNFYVTSENINVWKDYAKVDKNNKQIFLTKIEQKQKLHQSWAKEKNKKSWLTSNSNIEGKIKVDNYFALQTEIDQYNWLDNKVHLLYIKDLHELIIDILGRLAGYIAKFDRDVQFLDRYLNKTDCTKYKGLNFKYSLPDLSKNTSYKKAYKETIVGDLFDDYTINNPKYRYYRNTIAHFNYLSKEAEVSIICTSFDLIKQLSLQKNESPF